MEVGLLVRYGKPVPGREQQAIELFAGASSFFGAKLDAGVITHFEPYFLQTSDREEETGFMILKGPVGEIFKLMEEEAYLTLAEKALALVEHFRVDLLTVGEGVGEQIERSAKVRTELGL